MAAQDAHSKTGNHGHNEPLFLYYVISIKTQRMWQIEKTHIMESRHNKDSVLWILSWCLNVCVCLCTSKVWNSTRQEVPRLCLSLFQYLLVCICVILSTRKWRRKHLTASVTSVCLPDVILCCLYSVSLFPTESFSYLEGNTCFRLSQCPGVRSRVNCFNIPIFVLFGPWPWTRSL